MSAFADVEGDVSESKLTLKNGKQTSISREVAFCPASKAATSSARSSRI